MNNSTSPQYVDFFRRLRARSVSSFDVAGRSAAVAETLERLEAWTAAAENREARTVPYLGAHVYADQVAVLTGDALEAGVDRSLVAAELAGLAARLSVRI